MNIQTFTGSRKLGRIENFHDLWYHYSLRARKFARYQPSALCHLIYMVWTVLQAYRAGARRAVMPRITSVGQRTRQACKAARRVTCPVPWRASPLLADAKASPAQRFLPRKRDR